jgi:hypothetical protein
MRWVTFQRRQPALTDEPRSPAVVSTIDFEFRVSMDESLVGLPAK